jgi:hypothetical protein
MQQNICTQDSKCMRTFFAYTNSDSNILATVEKANWVTFIEEDCSTSVGSYAAR